MNARKLGNAGKSGHVLLAYIADLRARKFDIVITECVPGSNASVFQHLLGSLYDVRSIVVFLSEQGHAAYRTRRWNILVLFPSAGGRYVLPGNFEDVFSRVHNTRIRTCQILC